MAWKFDTNRPIYVQLVERISASIASGEYPPGSKMPSVRDMAMEAGVNPNTLQRAFAELERQGLLYTKRTEGRYVTDNGDALAKERERLVDLCMEECRRKLLALGIEEAELEKEMSAWMKRRKESV